MNDHESINRWQFGALLMLGALVGPWWTAALADETERRPNILLVISDDQSWPHASVYGSRMARTPNFDRIAREGVLFTEAFCASPGCSPCRAALLTGLNTWQLEYAGTHASYFSPEFVTYPTQLAKDGYHVGFTGKGWGPGDFQRLGWEHNPAGIHYRGKPGRAEQRSANAAAFLAFLQAAEPDQPFCFWFGSHDPHRAYDRKLRVSRGKATEEAEVPAFLPDVPEVRDDLLDYSAEIERYDDELGEMLGLLEQRGQLQNTLIIATSDNGMPFPRAKANCYEYGIHMPLAIRWGNRVPAGRVVHDLVGFTDLTATIYDAAQVTPPEDKPLAGKSLLPLLQSEASGMIDPERTAVFAARERHSSSRFNSLGYPQRCIRTREHLLVWNCRPERWPAGAPRKYASVDFAEDGAIASAELGPEADAYHDIDGGPTLSYMANHRGDRSVQEALEWAVAKRPEFELFDIRRDPSCLHNVADDADFVSVREELRLRLMHYLQQTQDPRVLGNGDIWETYPRVSPLRWFPTPEWAEGSPDLVPDQPWLDSRRP